MTSDHRETIVVTGTLGAALLLTVIAVCWVISIIAAALVAWSPL